MYVEESVEGPITGEKVGKMGVYVFEAPLRLWHWINALCIVVLATTGWFIAAPLPSMAGEASDNYLMGYIRFVHFATAYVFAVALLGRLYWAFAGNHHSQQIFVLNVTNPKWWDGALSQLRWYLFLEKQPRKFIGHNPLDQIATFLLFTLPVFFLVVTGFALYSEGAGQGSWQDRLFGWVIPLFGGSQAVHSWHHLAMWVVICFVIIHIYTAIREDIMSRQSFISTMIGGYRMFKD